MEVVKVWKRREEGVRVGFEVKVVYTLTLLTPMPSSGLEPESSEPKFKTET